MEPHALEFLQKLLEAPAPSGYERPVQDVVREYVGGVAEELTTDVHGNVIACVRPEARPRLMLDGHCDQIGLLVSQIDEQGFIYTQTIGGWDPQQLVGQRMVVWTRQGPVPGVISRKPIHLQDEQERQQVVKHKDLWIDIGARDKQQAEQLVRIGDPVTLRLGMQTLENNLANAPGMDNAAGVWVVMEAFRRARRLGARCGLFAVSTVQEEIGLRGAQTSAFRVDPQVALAVDVTHATDCPTIDKRQQGEIRLGAGPVIFRGPSMNPAVVERLIALCGQHEIPYQLSAIGRPSPNDTSALQINRAGVATGLVSIPNRYMHSAVETISLDDIDHAADLLAAFAVSLSEADDFTP
ncbi:MAG: M42 family metallopeptidase [Pirellulaceae bacterium]|nr:M42 family metallopeptidase [Pirellulaceae bacterium]